MCCSSVRRVMCPQPRNETPRSCFGESLFLDEENGLGSTSERGAAVKWMNLSLYQTLQSDRSGRQRRCITGRRAIVLRSNEFDQDDTWTLFITKKYTFNYKKRWFFVILIPALFKSVLATIKVGAGEMPRNSYCNFPLFRLLQRLEPWYFL